MSPQAAPSVLQFALQLRDRLRASRSTITGIAPSAAQAWTIAAPIPLAPPVTMMTLSFSCRSMR